MTEAELIDLQRAGKVQMVGNAQTPQPAEDPFSMDGYLPVLETLRRAKKHLTAHPTASFIPTNFLDQFQIVDDGVNRFLDVYINGHWYSFTGTLIV